MPAFCTHHIEASFIFFDFHCTVWTSFDIQFLFFVQKSFVFIQNFFTSDFSDFFQREKPPVRTIFSGTFDFFSSYLYLSFQVAFQTRDAINTFAFFDFIGILGFIIQRANITNNSFSHFDQSLFWKNFLEIVQKIGEFWRFCKFLQICMFSLWLLVLNWRSNWDFKT